MPTARRVLVLGASGGLGAAFVRALRDEADVVALSRRDDGLDLTRESTLADAAARLASGPPFDTILVATGALAPEGGRPPRAFRDADPDRFAWLFAVNATGPALAIKHFGPLLSRTGRCTVAVLSARLGSIADNGLGGWVDYRASKAALNQIVRCAAIELGRRNPDTVVAALHPGTIETAMTRAHARGAYTASADESARALLDVLDAHTPSAGGLFLDYAGRPIPW